MFFDFDVFLFIMNNFGVIEFVGVKIILVLGWVYVFDM